MQTYPASPSTPLSPRIIGQKVSQANEGHIGSIPTVVVIPYL